MRNAVDITPICMAKWILNRSTVVRSVKDMKVRIGGLGVCRWTHDQPYVGSLRYALIDSYNITSPSWPSLIASLKIKLDSMHEIFICEKQILLFPPRHNMVWRLTEYKTTT